MNWLKDGDQNTSFFYIIVAIRNAYNSMRSLTLENGTVTTDIEEMSIEIVSYFTSLLAPDYMPQLSVPLQWVFRSAGLPV